METLPGKDFVGQMREQAGRENIQTTHERENVFYEITRIRRSHESRGLYQQINEAECIIIIDHLLSEAKKQIFLNNKDYSREALLDIAAVITRTLESRCPTKL